VRCSRFMMILRRCPEYSLVAAPRQKVRTDGRENL
jgi:hypothetical protein